MHVMRTTGKRDWLPPARDIIAKFGADDVSGVRRLSAMLKISETRIYNWMYAKGQGGSGGFIPLNHHRAILTAARELDVPLTPAELSGLQEFDEPKPVRKGTRKASASQSAQRALNLPLQAAE